MAFGKIFRREKPHRNPEGKVALAIKKHGITLVLDIGANVGQTGLALRQWGYGERIVSFEPVPAAHDALVKAAANDPLWHVAEPMAIGDKPGQAEIGISEATDMSSFKPATPDLLDALPKTRLTEKIMVPVTRLDDVFDDYAKPDDTVYLKIDTQGYECEVLAGARQCLPRIAGIQIEMSLLPLYDNETLIRDHLNFLYDQGFHPWLMLPVGYSRKQARQLQLDGVFFRD